MAAPTIDAVLTGLAQDNATGSLRVGKEGTVYLVEGRVSYVECAATSSVDELLTASGRISGSGMRSVRQAAGHRGEGGDLLVRRGVLSRGELQFCVLAATLDAAFFLLRPSAARGKFKEGETHWLGTHWFFDVPGLLRECVRRKALLEHAWPYDQIDGRPMTPIRHVEGAHVVLTSLQWELLLAADDAASPVELARRLGRPAYSVLLAVRRLAAAGLIATPEGTQPDGTQVNEAQPDGTRADDRGAPALPKRAAVGEMETSLPQVTAEATDVSLLIRLRDALEAL
jgi:hypothetical protein